MLLCQLFFETFYLKTVLSELRLIWTGFETNTKVLSSFFSTILQMFVPSRNKLTVHQLQICFKYLGAYRRQNSVPIGVAKELRVRVRVRV